MTGEGSVATDPAEVAVQRDLCDIRMSAAADDGRFRVLGHEHPLVRAWVQVGTGRLGLLIEVSAYPGAAPAGQPWDLESDSALPPSRWPMGGRPVFRQDWSVGNGNAPYLAVDRVALQSHPTWAVELPGRAWNTSKTIYDYLDAMHDALSLSRLPDAA